MSNPFSTDSLAPNFAKAFAILKGDTPGHQFHGNQYQSGIPSGVHTINGKNVIIAPKTDLSGAKLRDANLRGADLQLANLQEARLIGANLQEANLQGANLGGAFLISADLSNANLSGSDLRGANLINALLEQADMSNADLRSADLRSANMSNAHLDGTTGDENTKLPSGYEVVNGFVQRTKELIYQISQGYSGH